MSVMTESEATRLGLTIRAGLGSISEPSGKGVGIRTATAKDLRLGSMLLHDVSFAIIPNEGPWSSMPPGTGGILGMPIWQAVQQVKWSNRGTWEFGRRSATDQRTSGNVVFSGNHLLLRTSVSGARVFGTLDTGAIDTDLNQTFADEFPALIKNVTQGTRDIIGLGGTSTVASMTLPELRLLIGPTTVVLRPAHVTLQRTAAIGGSCCIGNVGLDVLAQTGNFTLDLSSMVLSLQ
jgi:hypothetical protein